MILALSLVFTSCDDILGEWSRPTPQTPQAPSKTAGTISYAATTYKKGTADPVKTFTNPLTFTGDGTVVYESSNTAVATVDATGKVTFTGTPGTTIIKAKVDDTDTYTYAVNEASYTLEVESGYSYLAWDGSKFVTKTVAESDVVKVTSSTTTWNETLKTYVVEGTVNILSTVSFTSGASSSIKLLLCDGAKLTIDGHYLAGNINTDSLTIYAQSEGEGMGELNVSQNGNDVLEGKGIAIHGGKLTITSTGTSGTDAIYAKDYLNIYGGVITAQGSSNGAGIWSNGDVTISGKAKVTAKGGDYAGGYAGKGISGILEVKDYAVVEAYGGSATSGNYKGGNGITGPVTIRDHAQVTAKAGASSGTTSGVGGIPTSVYYYGGTLIAIGGARGTGASSTTDGTAGGTLYNKTGGTIYFANNTDGSDMFSNVETIPADVNSTINRRGIKVYK